MNQRKITFIGGGNIARSLVSGLLAADYDANTIWMADPDQERLNELNRRFSVNTTSNNSEAVNDSHVVVLAVKPQILHDVCIEIKPEIQKNQPLIVSVAAGVGTQSICQWLNCEPPLIRTMPNTPAAIGAGATALFATPTVSLEQRSLAESLMRSVGITVWVDRESLMDTVTALSGSGPAYFFLVMEMLEQTAIEQGLDPEIARLLTLQTAFGSAKMALESDIHVSELRQHVTSPGGTTEQAINALEEGRIRELFTTALGAARLRSEELSVAMGGKS